MQPSPTQTPKEWNTDTSHSLQNIMLVFIKIQVMQARWQKLVTA